MSTSTTQTPTPTANAVLLDHLLAWSAELEPRLRAQLSLLEVLEEHIGVELRTHYAGPIDPRLVQDLLDAALQRHISQQPLTFDPALHAPWRWEGQAVQEIDQQRRETVELLIESIGTRLLDHYHDYLTRHWQTVPDDLPAPDDYRQRRDAWLAAHQAELNTALAPAALAELSIAEVRAAIHALERAWHEQNALICLASADERAALDRLAQAQLPDRLNPLDAAEHARLQDARDLWRAAQMQARRLLSGVASLHEHARQIAADYLAEQFDIQLSPDLIRVELGSREHPQLPPLRRSLSELVAGGAQELDLLYELRAVSSVVRLSAAPSADQVQRLVRECDGSAGYLAAVQARHAQSEVRQALLDAADRQLRYSALRGEYAGHLSTALHEQLLAALEQPSAQVHVSSLEVFDAPCSDLLVFSFNDDRGETTALALYAPGKPDGQEWIMLPSARALSAELGQWLGSAAGRHYLLSQLPFDQRQRLGARLQQVQDAPAQWPLDGDLRSATGDYSSALQRGLQARLHSREAQLARTVAPHWYGAASLDERRAITHLRQRARLAEQAFARGLGGYPSFHGYARKAVGEAIAPYLASKGLSEAVDPESIIIDLNPSLGDGPLESINLIDLVCFGYDDNSGIDHPERGVRSALGQDLSALRSADLARYARRAYLGEQYVAEVRARYLAASGADYRPHQLRFAGAVSAGMERDLRLALASGQLQRSSYERLLELISELLRLAPDDLDDSSSEAVLDRAGVLRLRVAGAPIIGCYVFRLIGEGAAEDWLYTADAPDGVLWRPYARLAAAAGATLSDYLLTRSRLAQRGEVERQLRALAGNQAHLDSLRLIDLVVNLPREFDRFVEHGLADVDDATHSRAEVIRGQVIKGLLFAAPLSLVYPPFAALLGAWFVVAPLRTAVIAHTRGDTARALQAWLEASWAALSGLASLPGASLRAVRPLLQGTRRVGARARVHVTAASRPAALEFDRRWAVPQVPDQLQAVHEPGIWLGTWRSAASTEVPGVEHFIRHQGRYFKVDYDSAQHTLRVFKANSPGSLHRPAVLRGADGRWLANSPGLRGGAPLEDAGRITSPRQVALGEGAPDNLRGALQGEALVARLSESSDDAYLFTLNAQTCVAVSLYNPATQAGAVIHLDHNIKPLIEQAVREVLVRIRGEGSSPVRAVMAGGDWLGGQDIGGPLRAVLRQNGVRPSWQHWSYSSCLGNTYGLTLDLRSGMTRVYSMDAQLVESVLDPLMRVAQRGAGGALAERARRFMARVRSEPLYQGSDGLVRNAAGQVQSASAYRPHGLALVDLSGG
ncbi:dermonecrotic toxin domain-containing protein [Pseudomonas cremoricolorata]|uniref:dermonecrotic toxin domain-containing protein n=1 Tax=Pseudomonas cremoricolorata TaxID=157783 RepID=UPI00041CB45A|nr:DUF6543 domain-containing protein [Pseudomonas cremoricolorata]